MKTMDEVQQEASTTGGEGVPGPQKGKGRAWTAVGVVVVAAAVLVALFFGAMRNSTGTSVANPPRRGPQPAVVAPVVPVTGPIEVSLSEFKVGVPATVAAGQVTLNIRNDGTVPHELLVFKSALPVSQYPRAQGGIDEEGAGITNISDGDNLDPAGTQARTVDLSTPGTYVFVCNLPGHFAAGMYTTVVVK